MNDLERCRLYTGDTATDPEFQYLPDTTYQFLIDEAGGSVIDAAVEALESIINEMALSPQEEKAGAYTSKRASIEELESRLNDLKNKRDAQKLKAVPIIMHTDRKDYCEFDKLFRGI